MSYERLEEVEEKIAYLLREEKEKAEDYEFNIFNVAGIATSEVHMCNVLFELLNPNGRHNQGNKYLKAFIKHFFRKDLWPFPQPIAKDISVKMEQGTDKNRRIDIVMQDRTRLIPIEVKIFAKDQTNQCADYLKFAKEKSLSDDTKLFYLTPDGRPPYDESAKDLYRKKEIIAISWSDISEWLRKCETMTKGKDKKHVGIIIRQFASAVQKFVLLNEFYQDKLYVELVNKSLVVIGERLIGMGTPLDDGGSITYEINKSEGLFFRVQRDPSRNSIAAGLISGTTQAIKLSLSASNKGRIDNFSRLAEKYGSVDKWWLEMESIVPYGELYRLYDKVYLNQCIDKIMKYYISSKEKWNSILSKSQHS